jgi:N6-L-threonylcarbamoyladenine synthase
MVRDYDRFEILGETLDDAAGEAYDKVARILGLGYPGGPVIERLARRGDRDALRFTCRAVGRSLNFSFSGIKTAVLYYAERHNLKWPRKKRLIYDVAASFQEAVLRVIVENTVRAIKKYDSATLVIGGGVSANSRFREMIREEGAMRGFKAFFPPLSLCSDNAAMVAGLAYRMLRKGRTAGPAITAYT